MKKKILYPSLKLEEKTKALNGPIWGFVGLISMFSIPLLVIVTHILICNILSIESTLISDNILILISIILVFGLIFGIGLYKYLYSQLISYKIENNTIIKGFITKTIKFNDNDNEIRTKILNSISLGLIKQKQYSINNTIFLLAGILNRIELNSNKDFVNAYFDTNLYKKYTYENVKLLKETKNSLIYISDNNKKIVIRKMYEGMDISIPEKRSLRITRILKRSLLVLLIFFLLSSIDLIIGINNNDKYKNNINNTCNKIKTTIEKYNFENTKDCIFEKKVSNYQNSTIKYNIDKNGNIKKVSFQLYYNIENYNKEEFKNILNSLNTNFTNSEIDKFINTIEEGIYNSFSYTNLRNNKYNIYNGLSGDYITINMR